MTRNRPAADAYVTRVRDGWSNSGMERTVPESALGSDTACPSRAGSLSKVLKKTDCPKPEYLSRPLRAKGIPYDPALTAGPTRQAPLATTPLHAEPAPTFIPHRLSGRAPRSVDGPGGRRLGNFYVVLRIAGFRLGARCSVEFDNDCPRHPRSGPDSRRGGVSMVSRAVCLRGIAAGSASVALLVAVGSTESATPPPRARQQWSAQPARQSAGTTVPSTPARRQPTVTPGTYAPKTAPPRTRSASAVVPSRSDCHLRWSGTCEGHPPNTRPGKSWEALLKSSASGTGAARAPVRGLPPGARAATGSRADLAGFYRRDTALRSTPQTS
ncbi:hypothetical protein BX283_7727 [Streptomyces sp. TLI_146]|nr:hypothetical protein BX283_7727 [Streptomyces sp. TLI_146]